MPACSLTVADETVAPGRRIDDLRQALIALWPHFMWAGLFSSAINLLYLSSPLYLMQVYNRVLLNENIATLVLLTLILAVALLTMAALDAVRACILIRCGIRLDMELSRRVFEALVVRSAARGSSGGAQQLRNLDQFRTFVTGPGIYFAFDLPWIPIYLLLLFFIHPLLGTVASIGAMLLLALAGLNEALTRDPLKQAEVAGNQSYVFTENILRHADVIRAMGMQPAVERNWQSQRSSMLLRQALASDKNAVMTASIRFFRLLLQSLMLGTGAWLAIDHTIAPATIFAASIVMGRALVPVEQAVATWKQFIGAREAYAEVRELLEAVDLTPPRTIVPRARNALEARDLRCTLPSRREAVIKSLSFDLASGQALGIVGPSGSGKSTLARALVGAIAPAGGRLRFGGLDYSHWDPLEFGRLVGYLPQDVGLFVGTVRENIARFGNASTEEIIDAATRAGIHEMILDLPGQYDTRLGPGGVGLSGGQRQRLALARAMLGRPPLLVLDEPNANLDGPGEEALKAALLQAKGEGATVIVITHRTTILDVVDAMMVLRDGVLEMLGPPEEIYRSLQQRAAARQAS
ncbi:type I secretion system permease/ATPase [Bradyrhizobium sp.]|uniref:type I secretion system permease/ATPase n=1 Tax=Bradyrhizobium sp. TaxID=376 RepID=UPI0040377CF6